MRIDKAKSALQRLKARVAGRIVEEDKDTLAVRMGGYLLEIPRDSVLHQEKESENTVILSLKPDAELLMTTVTPVDEMIGVISSRIVKGSINADTECCDCTECSYCTDCTECSYCTERGWGMRTRVLGRLGLGRLGRYARF